jgi:sulfur carrier protein
MALSLRINGTERTLENLDDGARLDAVIAALSLKSDRVAVEWNGEIAPRAAWASVSVSTGDRLEVVHFVGGGCA